MENPVGTLSGYLFAACTGRRQSGLLVGWSEQSVMVHYRPFHNTSPQIPYLLQRLIWTLLILKESDVDNNWLIRHI